MKPDEKSNRVDVDAIGRKRKMMMKANPLAQLLQQARLANLFTLIEYAAYQNRVSIYKSPMDSTKRQVGKSQNAP